MPKVRIRPHSRIALTALQLLGGLVRARRLEQAVTAKQLAERAGISRALLHRIEAGDPGCSVGAVFEVAAIIGIPLFEEDQAAVASHAAAVGKQLVLLPKAARRRTGPVKDDF